MKRKNKIAATAIALAGIAMQPSAFAEGETAIEEKSAAVKQASWTERDSLFIGEIAENHLQNVGFTPSLFWTGEQWSNVGGGVKRGTTWDSLFTLGLDQDISKLSNSKNLGTLGMTAYYYTASADFSGDYVGAQSDPSNIFSGDMLRIFEIFYLNKFETEVGSFGIRIGQLSADEDFMCLDYADLFLNSSFGAIPSNSALDLSNGAQAFSQYALATAGAAIFWENGKFDAIVAVYNGNCGEDISTNNGFDYALQDISFWYQGGYNYKIGGMSGRVQVGGNYHSGTFENLSGKGETECGFYSFYCGIQQDLICGDDGSRILGSFIRAGWAPKESISAYTKYIDAGLLWFAPFPSRESDVLGLGVSTMELGSAYRDSDGYRSFDTMVEVTYRAQLTNSIALQPAFQIYFDARNANANANPNAAYVLGARLEINL